MPRRYIYDHQDLSAEVFDGIEYRDNQVLIRVQACAISPREFAGIHSTNAILGNAVLGIVIEAGTSATGWLGKRVLAPTLQPCGECDSCRRGAPGGCAQKMLLGHDGNGGLCEIVVASARWLTPLENQLSDLPMTAAALAGDGLRAYSAYCYAGVAPKDPVVVLGAGTSSLLIVQLAGIQGANVIHIKAGVKADAEIGGSTLDIVGEHIASLGEKPWQVFVLDPFFSQQSGPVNDFSAFISLLPSGSTLVIGLSSDTHLNGINREALLAMCNRGITIMGTSHGHPDLLPELAALSVNRELNLDALVDSATIDELSSSPLRLSENAASHITTIGLWTETP